VTFIFSMPCAIDNCAHNANTKINSFFILCSFRHFHFYFSSGETAARARAAFTLGVRGVLRRDRSHLCTERPPTPEQRVLAPGRRTDSLVESIVVVSPFTSPSALPALHLTSLLNL